MSITYSDNVCLCLCVCVCVCILALVIQKAIRMRLIILSSVGCLALLFHIISKRTTLGGKKSY